MNIRDFDRRFAAAQRSHARLSKVVFGLIAVVWILVFSGIGFAIYLASTTSPEELGSFFGRIVSGFQAASNSK